MCKDNCSSVSFLCPRGLYQNVWGQEPCAFCYCCHWCCFGYYIHDSKVILITVVQQYLVDIRLDEFAFSLSIKYIHIKYISIAFSLSITILQPHWPVCLLEQILPHISAFPHDVSFTEDAIPYIVLHAALPYPKGFSWKTASLNGSFLTSLSKITFHFILQFISFMSFIGLFTIFNYM